MTVQHAKAFAPASVANVAIGFDILGFSVDALGDSVTVHRSATPGVARVRPRHAVLPARTGHPPRHWRAVR